MGAADAELIDRGLELLGVARGDRVDPAWLRARHRDLVHEHHPDHGGDPAAFQAVVTAARAIAARDFTAPPAYRIEVTGLGLAVVVDE